MAERDPKTPKTPKTPKIPRTTAKTPKIPKTLTQASKNLKVAPGPSAMARLIAEAMISEMSIPWVDFLAAGGKAHTEAQCAATKAAGGPKHCVVHNPSVHPMRDWPLILRSTTLLERMCPHRTGHPDPDSAAFLNWRDHTDAWSMHGCDGCCPPALAGF